MMQTKWLAAPLLAATAMLGACGGAYVASYGPPPPRYGVVGVAPGPGYVWADGYWNLSGGNWRWEEGSWRRPPHRGAAWVHPEWRKEGSRWRFHRGHWR